MPPLVRSSCACKQLVGLTNQLGSKHSLEPCSHQVLPLDQQFKRLGFLHASVAVWVEPFQVTCWSLWTPKIPYSGIFSDGNGWNLFTLPKVCQHLRLNDPAVMANVPTQDEANALWRHVRQEELGWVWGLVYSWASWELRILDLYPNKGNKNRTSMEYYSNHSYSSMLLFSHSFNDRHWG